MNLRNLANDSGKADRERFRVVFYLRVIYRVSVWLRLERHVYWEIHINNYFVDSRPCLPVQLFWASYVPKET